MILALRKALQFYNSTSDTSSPSTFPVVPTTMKSYLYFMHSLDCLFASLMPDNNQTNEKIDMNPET